MRPPLSLLFVLLAFALTPAAAETISAAEAKNHVGENTTVCGVVASERTSWHTSAGRRRQMTSQLVTKGGADG